MELSTQCTPRTGAVLVAEAQIYKKKVCAPPVIEIEPYVIANPSSISGMRMQVLERLHAMTAHDGPAIPLFADQPAAGPEVTN